MVAKELISDEIPVVNTSDTGQKALNWMEVFRISHLPIVNHQEFLGLISDTDIFDMNTPDEAIGNHKLSLIKPFVLLDQHIFDVVAIASVLKLSVVPVLDEKNIYKGVIKASDLIDRIAEMSSLKEPGGIIIISLHQNDYSLSQIAQIIESNDAKVLNLYISSPPESTKMELTIKLNTANIAPIIRTFERFDYEITYWHGDDDAMDRFYSDRYDSLMRYLDV
ncbi:MAG: CBS domain-containing protein [Marinilabiliaceae bacterium]|jgi:predicted transcriptional regulator|nr:CBS domain-containing protein [Marinilabiliaceae bacterium]